jgi:hypothetical protein
LSSRVRSVSFPGPVLGALCISIDRKLPETRLGTVETAIALFFRPALRNNETELARIDVVDVAGDALRSIDERF